jgi:hypothetical protein
MTVHLPLHLQMQMIIATAMSLSDAVFEAWDLSTAVSLTDTFDGATFPGRRHSVPYLASRQKA